MKSLRVMSIVKSFFLFVLCSVFSLVYAESSGLNLASSTQYRTYEVVKGEKGESQYEEAEKYRFQKDFKRAEKFYSKAAEMGFGMAHFRLGQMYATGRGSVRSLVEAHMHYNLSSYLGVTQGRSAMLVLEDQMTEDQIERAMRRAVNYRSRHDL